MFNPGEEVICIDNSPGYAYGDPCPFTKGNLYMVLDSCELGVVVNGDRGIWWSAKRFRRPIIDKSKLEIINEALV